MTLPLSVDVILTAAGQSRRMQGQDKLTLPLAGRPLIAHSASVFLNWPPLRNLVITVSPGREDELQALILQHTTSSPATLHVIAGGRERQESIFFALEHLMSLNSSQPDDPILIHDAARPFVHHALFQDLIDHLESWDGAIPAIPVRDTVKRVKGSLILHTEDRETLRLVQTPQAFRFGPIQRAHRQAQAEAFLGTDDASLIERYDGKVCWILGPAHNIKVTVPEDLALLTTIPKSL